MKKNMLLVFIIMFLVILGFMVIKNKEVKFQGGVKHNQLKNRKESATDSLKKLISEDELKIMLEDIEKGDFSINRFNNDKKLE